jgi:signal transduction histidine kinase
MVQVTLGVSKIFYIFKISNYSLTKQIIIVNLVSALLGFLFLIFYNISLLNSNENIQNHTQKINSQLTEITTYLSNNAIKRILAFDDNCVRILREDQDNSNCNLKNLKNNYDQLPQLDPSYTQEYIYSIYGSSKSIIMVFNDNWIKYADTKDYYDENDLVILNINAKNDLDDQKKLGLFEIYKNYYINFYNFIKTYLDKKKFNKLKNDNITIMETIKSKKSISYIYKNKDKKFMSRSTSPILRDNKVYGVVLIISPLTVYDYENASKSFLLLNFLLFFISITLFLSILFSKSIVNPIKRLSQITMMEKDKSLKFSNDILYPDRKDEIGNLSSDIKRMSDDLKKRIKEIEEFASDVSHELKNPLAGLKSSSDLLKNNNLDVNKKIILIENMSKDINRMNILISDISNYSLTQVEISEEAFEKINIVIFLNNFIKSFSGNLLLLDIHNNHNEIYIKINQSKFSQVMYNLIDNSRTYTSQKSKILISVNKANKYLVIEIVDQGPGIPLKHKDKIFERFYTDRSKNRDSHSGLGLSISKKIIESLGGSITLIKSTHLGFNGACFEIKLPLKDL